METKQAAWRPQHITIVSETFPPEINGVANTLGYLCRGLVDRGHQVTVIRPRQPNRPKGTEASALDVDTARVPGLPLPGYPDLRFGLALPCLLRRRWSEDPPDVIYVATQGPLGVAAVRAARSLGLYVISGFQTRFDQYSRYYGAGALEPLLKRYGRWFHNQTRTTLVLVGSGPLRPWLEQRYPHAQLCGVQRGDGSIIRGLVSGGDCRLISRTGATA